MELFNDIIEMIDDRGLSYEETKEVIKDYFGIKIDFRTKKGIKFLKTLGEKYELYKQVC